MPTGQFARIADPDKDAEQYFANAITLFGVSMRR
jgi:hypothetical protein